MHSVLSAAVAAVVFISSIGTQSGASVAGKWDLSADTPHGVMAMALDLQQSGEKVTGKLVGFMNRDFEVRGEFKGGQLTLTTADEQLSFAASLKPDGSLAGHLSTPQGDVPWKAVRSKKS